MTYTVACVGENWLRFSPSDWKSGDSLIEDGSATDKDSLLRASLPKGWVLNRDFIVEE
jgi:hypothetical protein